MDPPETPTIWLKSTSNLLRASSMPIWAASLVPPPEKIGTIMLIMTHRYKNVFQVEHSITHQYTGFLDFSLVMVSVGNKL